MSKYNAAMIVLRDDPTNPMTPEDFADIVKVVVNTALSLGLMLGNTGDILEAMAAGNFERSEEIQAILAQPGRGDDA